MRAMCHMLAILALVQLAGCATVGHNEAGIENFDRVSPMVFRGAQPTDEGFRTLAALGVKTVINLRDEKDPHEAAAVAAAGMSYVALPQDATTATLSDADHFLALLPRVPGPVFVHCHAGRDRTGLAVAAYRLRIEHWTGSAALRDLYRHGHNWVLFPKVREVIGAMAAAQLAETLPKVAPPDAQPVVAALPSR